MKDLNRKPFHNLYAQHENPTEDSGKTSIGEKIFLAVVFGAAISCMIFN